MKIFIVYMYKGSHDKILFYISCFMVCFWRNPIITEIPDGFLFFDYFTWRIQVVSSEKKNEAVKKLDKLGGLYN